jgi:FkbM family methyltransferase
MQVMAGVPSDLPPTAADDVPLLRAGCRLAWLRLLGGLGVRTVAARSDFGHRFICHIGDLAEFPYYHRKALEKELALSAAWLRDESEPIIYDVGANVGFFSTQLSQMLTEQGASVYAFEASPATFAKLVRSIQDLRLVNCVHPVAAAVLDGLEPAAIAHSLTNPLCSHVLRRATPGPEGAFHTSFAAGLTLDRFHALTGKVPSLVKIDVEGFEIDVLRGATSLLSRTDDRPAILFEFNPWALSLRGESSEVVAGLLPGYEFYYVDDLSGQKLPFGSKVAELRRIDWICNLFALPEGEDSDKRWRSALQQSMRVIQKRHR